MKIAPLIEVMSRYPEMQQTLLHTGQHYDAQMSRVFFEDLGLPRPDIHLGVGSGSHAEQTARVMVDFEKVLLDSKPDLVVVVGDVNSTLACAITAAKLWIPVAHIEAGLRSFDRRMPEEINRIVTDSLSELLFTTSRDANANLRRENISEERIHFVGNVMIDTLIKHKASAKKLETPMKFGLRAGGYALLTLHRPSNVDVPDVLSGILDALEEIQSRLPILFPAHPRTMERLRAFGFLARLEAMSNFHIVRPLGYLEFLDLMMHARLVLTDSGGIQEETTVLSIPCLTLRDNTERPVTISEGTNTLVGAQPARILAETRKVLEGQRKSGRVPELWDGRAAQRIVATLREYRLGQDG